MTAIRLFFFRISTSNPQKPSSHTNTICKPCKGLPVHTTRGCTSSIGIAPLILNLDARWTWVVTFTPRPPYFWERTAVPTEQDARCAPRVGLHLSAKRKISCPCRDSSRRPPSPKPSRYNSQKTRKYSTLIQFSEALPKVTACHSTSSEPHSSLPLDTACNSSHPQISKTLCKFQFPYWVNGFLSFLWQICVTGLKSALNPALFPSFIFNGPTTCTSFYKFQMQQLKKGEVNTVHEED